MDIFTKFPFLDALPDGMVIERDPTLPKSKLWCIIIHYCGEKFIISTRRVIGNYRVYDMTLGKPFTVGPYMSEYVIWDVSSDEIGILNPYKWYAYEKEHRISLESVLKR